MSVNGNKGFTLVESLIVITIMAILAAIAVPGMRMAQANSRVKSAASDISAVMADARSQAAGRQRSISLTAEPDGWNKGWVMAFTVAIAGVPDLAAHRGMPESIQLTLTPDIDELVFLPGGVVQKSDATAIDTVTFTVCDSNVAGESGKMVTLTRMGRTTIKAAVCN